MGFELPAYKKTAFLYFYRGAGVPLFHVIDVLLLAWGGTDLDRGLGSERSNREPFLRLAGGHSFNIDSSLKIRRPSVSRARLSTHEYLPERSRFEGRYFEVYPLHIGLRSLQLVYESL